MPAASTPVSNTGSADHSDGRAETRRRTEDIFARPARPHAGQHGRTGQAGPIMRVTPRLGRLRRSIHWTARSCYSGLSAFRGAASYGSTITGGAQQETGRGGGAPPRSPCASARAFRCASPLRCETCNGIRQMNNPAVRFKKNPLAGLSILFGFLFPLLGIIFGAIVLGARGLDACRQEQGDRWPRDWDHLYVDLASCDHPLLGSNRLRRHPRNSSLVDGRVERFSVNTRGRPDYRRNLVRSRRGGGSMKRRGGSVGLEQLTDSDAETLACPAEGIDRDVHGGGLELLIVPPIDANQLGRLLLGQLAFHTNPSQIHGERPSELRRVPGRHAAKLVISAAV